MMLRRLEQEKPIGAISACDSMHLWFGLAIVVASTDMDSVGKVASVASDCARGFRRTETEGVVQYVLVHALITRFVSSVVWHQKWAKRFAFIIKTYITSLRTFPKSMDLHTPRQGKSKTEDVQLLSSQEAHASERSLAFHVPH